VGFSWPSTASAYVVNNVAAGTVSGGGTNTVVVTVPVAVSASGSVTLGVAGVTNPTTAGSYQLSVETSSDAFPVQTPSGSMVIASSVTAASLSLSNTKAAGTGTNYTVGFTTSANGALVANVSTIILTLPATATIGTAAKTAFLINGVTPSTYGAVSNTVTLTVPGNIAASSPVSVVAENITNPAAGSYTVAVSTSADSAVVNTPSVTIGTQISGLSVTLANNAAAATGVKYTTNFTATTALVSGTGTITLTGSSGVTLPTSGWVVTDTTTTASASVTTLTGGGTSPVVLTVPVAIAATNAVSVTNSTFTNGAVGTYTLTVSTSADTAAFSASFTIRSAVTAVSVATSNAVVNGQANYTVSFTTTSPLSGAASNTISLCQPTAATLLPASADAYSINGVVASAIGAPTVSCPTGYGAGKMITLPGAASISAKATVTVVISGVTNPPAASATGTFALDTSQDAAYAVSSTFSITASAAQVTNVQVFNTGAAGGAPDTWTISMSLTDGLTATGTVNITAPTGTTWQTVAADWSASDDSGPVTLGAGPFVTSGGGLSIAVVLNNGGALAAGDVLTLEAAVSANPAAGNYELSVSTTADATAVTSSWMPVGTSATRVTPGTPVLPNLYAGTSATYTIPFTTSATGGFGAGANITLVSTNDVFTGITDEDVVVNGVPATDASDNAGAKTLTITSPIGVGNSTLVTLVITGVVNPPAGAQSTTIATSSDAAASTADTYTTLSGTQITAPALVLSSTAISSSTSYTVTFNANAGLAASGTVTFNAPLGTVFPASTGSNYVVNAVAATAVVGSPSSTVVITASSAMAAVSAGGAVTVTIQGVTNSSTVSSTDTLSISTSSDKIPNNTPAFSLGSTVSAVTGPVAGTNAAGLATATDTYSFKTSPTGALSAGQFLYIAVPNTSGGSLAVATPADFYINGVVATASAACGALTPTQTVCAKLTLPNPLGAGATVWLQIINVTNPGVAGTAYTSQIATSADSAFVATPAYTIGTQITGLTAVPAALTAGEAVTFNVGFTTSATGALTSGTGTITVSVPGSSTVFPSVLGDYLVDATAASTVTGMGTNSVTVTVPASIPASTSVTLVINSTLNASAGTYVAVVDTSADTVADTGSPFTLTAPPVSTVTAVSPTTGLTSGGTAVTITGTNFLPGATVKFGTVSATGITVVSATSITATSPANSVGVVDVTVTTGGGTSATSSADQFTYTSSYTPLAAPVRIFDSRSGNPSNLGSPFSGTVGEHLVASTPQTVQVTGSSPYPVPVSASAVVLNVTVVNPAAAGYLTVFPTGGTAPIASNLNFTTGQVVPNLVEVGLGTGGMISLESSVAADAIVDVEGYVGGATAGDLFGAITPVRVFDSRSGNPSNLGSPFNATVGDTLAAGTPQLVQVADTSSVTGYPAPVGTTAVVVNITVAETSGTGYLTAFAGGGTAPTASNLNFTKGEITTNRVIVPVNATTGQISLQSSVATDAIVDVNGFYNAASGTGTLQPSTEATPSRLVDTRTGNPSDLPPALSTLYTGKTLSAGGTLNVQVTGYANVPTGAKAVVLNLTSANPSAGTFLTVYPTGATMPTTSDLDPGKGDTEANLVIADLSSTGSITIYNQSGSIDVIVDILGWYS
jgi:hypothetical protein